jgi:hypothetical protein
MQNISHMPRPWILALALAAAACSYRSNPSGPPSSRIQKLVVAPSADTLAVGKTLQLSATAYDANGAPVSGVTITWKSEAPGVAKVDANGLVTGVSLGATQISATATATSAATVTVIGP